MMRRAPGAVALVPLRDPGAGKTRLEPALSPTERARLTEAMFRDVVRSLAQSPVSRIVVAAAGRRAAGLAAELDLEVLTDPAGDGGASSLDRAIAACTDRLAGAPGLLVVAADLPRLRPEDVRRILAIDADVAVAPTRDGGTGGLLRRPPDVMPARYGPGSGRRHVQAATRAGLRVVSVDLPGFAVDVDGVEDVVALSGDPAVGASTAAALKDLRRSVTGG